MQAVYLDKFLKVPIAARGCYRWFVHLAQENRSANPAECSECGQCEEKCTQGLKIIEEMKYASRVLDEKK